MSLVIIAGILSLIPFVYLLLLMTDARQLRERFRARALDYSENAQPGEGLTLEIPYMNARWSAWPARGTKPASLPTDSGEDAGGPAQAS